MAPGSMPRASSRRWRQRRPGTRPCFSAPAAMMPPPRCGPSFPWLSRISSMRGNARPEMLTLTGTPAAPGFAAGRVLPLSASDRAAGTVGAPAQEEAELTAAIEAARCELEALSTDAEGEEASGILAFQLALLEDEELTRPVLAAIAAGDPADGAWRAALDVQIADFTGSDNGYFRDRGADLAALRDRVLDRLAGLSATSIPPGTIVVADDLAPSRFLATDWQEGGLALARGSATSHV